MVHCVGKEAMSLHLHSQQSNRNCLHCSEIFGKMYRQGSGDRTKVL